MDVLKLEQQRQALEANLQRLRQSLKHWQTWEAEYEGLKEEIAKVDDDLDPSKLATIASTYNGDLVDEKEVRELAGLSRESPRSAEQIVGLIERRQEYVQKNIDTVQRQFFDAEAKSEELAFAAANLGGGESGLPLTEIHEELDEDGNVIASQLSRPEEATAKVVASLRKAGLSEDDLEQTSEPKAKVQDLKPAITNASPPITPILSTFSSEKRARSEPTMASPTSDGCNDNMDRPSVRKKSVSFTADTKITMERPRQESEDGKKSVSFNDKVAVMPAAPPPDNRSVSFSPMIEEIPAQSLGPGSPNNQPLSPKEIEKARALMVSGGQEEAVVEPETTSEILPEDESPEDAQLRREMLEYHLNEVGNVVAQIDLEDEDTCMEEYVGDENDDSSYHTTSEYPEDDDTPYTTGLSESEESEDEFGRSTRPQIHEAYRKRMEELQQKLIGNLGPEPNVEDVTEADPEMDPSDVRKLVIRDKPPSTSSTSTDSSEKKRGVEKRVSFAEELDVAEAESPPLKAQKLQEIEDTAPVAATIFERATGMARSENLPSARPSQFRQARAGAAAQLDDDSGAAADAASPYQPTETDHTRPHGLTTTPIASTLKERKTEHFAAPAPSPDDEYMKRRELAAEFYRRRNGMIRQQGGFKASADEDDGQGELMEEGSDGKVKKVSRFKAARIRS
ncbi:hypothetical protein LTR37_011932 [Vermiconidia calcicola]|uniref:Uncharacterized protein n=1 Tax=Vermiconidia calcicola TaxID=1690605 RepID=A0ACC3N0R9_9PEZI|nr:hypothetical protein LTR37_011932 [Vermiconidia calcicola]